MAERDERGGLLRGENARQPRGLQRVPFGDLAAPDQFQRGGAHRDRTARDRFARGDRLRADIYHLHAAALIDV